MITVRGNQRSLSTIDYARFHSLVLLVLLLGVGFIYGSTLAVNRGEAKDLLNYLKITPDGSVTDLLHPHHLFSMFSTAAFICFGD